MVLAVYIYIFIYFFLAEEDGYGAGVFVHVLLYSCVVTQHSAVRYTNRVVVSVRYTKFTVSVEEQKTPMTGGVI